MPTLITRLITAISGELVGEDPFGHKYYQSRTTPEHNRRRRWVVYAGRNDDASKVPPLYHSWLHHTTDAFPDKPSAHPWVQPHKPNCTGSSSSHKPPGHMLNPDPQDYRPYTPWSPS